MKNSASTVKEPARTLPVALETDVCVVGGSCTGVFAAVTAARLGARVALIENQGFLGGVATAGLVNVWHSLYDITGERQIIAGLTQETLERLGRRQAVVVRDRKDASVYAYMNTEELKIELDELVAEARVIPFLHTRFCAAIMDGPRLTAAVIEDKSGRRAIRAGMFIDATGDGDVLVRAGLPVRVADVLQPPTTCAIIQGCGELKRADPAFHLEKAVFDPNHPRGLRHAFGWSAPVVRGKDLTMAAITRVAGVNCADAADLTRAEIEGRRQVRSMLDVLRDRPAGDQVSLVGLAATIGIRETRHAVCLHQITEMELLHGTPAADVIGCGSYRVDVHHNGRPGITFRYLDGREEVMEDGGWRSGRWCPPGTATATYYQIPYRALVPQGAVNLLAAGRMLDADPGAYGALRVMVNCNQTGEAAGAAAWTALQRNCGVAEVPVTEVQSALRRLGGLPALN